MSSVTASPKAEPIVCDEQTRRARLDANLAALGDRNRVFADRIRRTPPSPAIAFASSGQDVPSATLNGEPLCSRHRPIDEAQRLAGRVNILDHATFIVSGFGMGYHVRELAARIERTGLIIVLEPDLSMLRSVFEHVDHSAWLRDALIMFVTDPDDRAELARLLDGAESTVALGVEFMEHPPSRKRLGTLPRDFSNIFAQYVETARTTLVTTLIRSVDTTRNLLLNIDHYVTGAGVADLAGCCAARPAVIVSAGPSMQRNIEALRQPHVRDNCVIIAVQTTLKPLLDAGIRPHFVTALDYHEISQRFYEGLDAADLADVTLVAEPKAHPVIHDIYPGPARCCASGFLDRVLGPMQRGMGTLPAGATVAHLALYLADYLGCNPIGFIGQDLGFSDGLYYAPGTAIHDVWAPELNPFNTIAMMEWQRIVRHRTHLRKIEDVHGRSIYTDAQMLTYLRQFERDFAELTARGIKIVDAGGSGVAKQHTTQQDLAVFLNQHATTPLPTIPMPPSPDTARVADACTRIDKVIADVRRIRKASEKAASLLDRMLEDQQDADRMRRHFAEMDRQRRIVDQHFQAFELINTINQLGAFKRIRADRRMQLAGEMAPIERQRLELERDRENVRWIADAAEEMIDQLREAQRVLRGEPVDVRGKSARELVRRARADAGIASGSSEQDVRVGAIIPIDPAVVDVRDPDTLADLQTVITNLGMSPELAGIIVLCSDNDADVLSGHMPEGVAIERCGASPFPAEHEAIRKARLFSPSSWRGGIAGLAYHDELLCPQAIARAMDDHELTAALLTPPDAPAIIVSKHGGCDELIARHKDFPERQRLVFTQAVPGLSAVLLSRALIDEMVIQRSRLGTIGAMLVYQPTLPQHDPIARDANVQLPPELCRPIARITTGRPRERTRWTHMRSTFDGPLSAPMELLQHWQASVETMPDPVPQHIIIESTIRRLGAGLFTSHPYGNLDRPDMQPEIIQAITEQLAHLTTEHDDIVVTLDGLGDALLHPQVCDLVAALRDSNIAALHIRTELTCDQQLLRDLLAIGVDVISIDLHADRAATYEAMMGRDDFRHVLENIDFLMQHRRCLTGRGGASGIGLPWIVPRLQRCAATYEDIDTFFDRWQHTLGAAVIEAPPEYRIGDRIVPVDDDLTPAPTPRQVIDAQLRRRMLILSDGSIPIDERDLAGGRCAGRIGESDLASLWMNLQDERQARIEDLGVFRP